MVSEKFILRDNGVGSLKVLCSEKNEKSMLRNWFDYHISKYLNTLSKDNNKLRNQRMAIYANDWIGININLYGFYENELLNSLFKFLSPLASHFSTGLALDIGANVGNHSIFFDRVFSKTFAFEPNPSTFKLLSFNASYANNVDIYNIGLGDQKGSFKLCEDRENFGGSTVIEHDVEGSDSVDINIETLDELDVNLSNLSFIKIDVEGFESNVIRGALSTLTTYQPIVVFEQQESEFNNGSTETIDLLRGLGYRFCWHQPASVGGGGIQRLFRLIKMFTGRYGSKLIVTGEVIPKATYSMLVGIPEKYQKTLGL